MREHETKNFWLQMTNDFYDSDRMLYLESGPEGQMYSLFYTKLLLKSIRTNGVLRLSEKIAYSEDMLAAFTRMPAEVVRGAMERLKSLDLVEVLEDGTIFLPELESMVGSETVWAGRKRRQREKQAELGQELDNVQDVSNENDETVGQCPINKRKEKNNKEKTNQSKEKERIEEAPACGDTPSGDGEKLKFGSYGWVRLTAQEHRTLIDELGQGELVRCIAYIDESAQATGNRNRWRDWALILRRCSREGWGRQTDRHTERQRPPDADGLETEQDSSAYMESIKHYLSRLKEDAS